MRTRVVSLLALAVASTWAHAAVRLPAVFSDHMMLQRDMPVPIWGWADAGETVTVRVAGQSTTVAADPRGRWMVRLKPLSVAKTPLTMTVVGTNTITVKDILVGDVWVCSGQSNMEMRLGSVADRKRHLAAAVYPNIRLCLIPDKWLVDGPRDDTPGARWQACMPQSAKRFSAVGYFFGRDLHQALHVPIGLIDNAKGGSPTESWTHPADMKGNPIYKPTLDRWEKWLAEYAKASKDQRAKHPMRRNAPTSHKRPGVLWNGMVAPLVPLAVKGVIWYQGEANLGRPYEYRTTFPAMIDSWRRAWQRDDLPFLFVQLPNHGKRTNNPNEHTSWPLLREAQTMTLRLPQTAMAVRIDGPEDIDYHPRNKEPFGRRLALAARGTVYGQDVVYSGPTYDRMTVEGQRVRVRFRHVGGGLVARDGPLAGFAVAGEHKVFHWAKATIDGDTVVLTCPDVARPVAVRYAFSANPVCNLYNKAGLPAVPFRTDQWTQWGKRRRRQTKK